MEKEEIKNVNPTFKQRFGICTNITYIDNIKVEEKISLQFLRSWKRFYRKADLLVSSYRQERFEAFFRQLKRDGSDHRYCSRFAIRFISKRVGYGVFAKEDISPYSTLNHYAGILMLDKEINPAYDSTFSFTDWKKYSIDAMNSGNWTRFMNHGGEKDEKTNVIAWESYLEEGPRIVFTAGKNGVKRGEQLLYSYGDSYWEEMGKFVTF